MQQQNLSLFGNIALRPNGVRSYAASAEMVLKSSGKSIIAASSRGTLKANRDVGAYANKNGNFIFCVLSLSAQR